MHSDKRCLPLFALHSFFALAEISQQCVSERVDGGDFQFYCCVLLFFQASRHTRGVRSPLLALLIVTVVFSVLLGLNLCYALLPYLHPQHYIVVPFAL